MLWNKYDRIDLYNNVITNTVFVITFGKSVPAQQLAEQNIYFVKKNLTIVKF